MIPSENLEINGKKFRAAYNFKYLGLIIPRDRFIEHEMLMMKEITTILQFEKYPLEEIELMAIIVLYKRPW